MNIESDSNKRYVTYDYHIKQPIIIIFQMVEGKQILVNAKNTHLIKPPDRRIFHPLLRKDSNIPFNVH